MKKSHVVYISSLILTFCISFNTFADMSEDDIVKLHANRGGFAVVVGDNNIDQILSLARQPHYALHILMRDEKDVTNIRRKLRNAGLYGKASVEKWAGDKQCSGNWSRCICADWISSPRLLN